MNHPRPFLAWGGGHPQVELPELGFSVDAGLEELILTIWAVGMRTTGCCIDQHSYSPSSPPGRGFIGFRYPSYLQWEELTRQPIDCRNVQVFTADGQPDFGFAYFYRDDIPRLIACL